MDTVADAELVQAALAGDRDAFDALVSRYQRATCAVARASLGDSHAAEDAAQEAFVTAYTELANLRNRAAFGAWLLRITRQKAARIGRTMRSRPLPVPDLVPDSEPSDLDDRSRDLLSAVAALPDAESQVIMLHYFDDHSVATIAEMLGRPVGTVTKQLSRAYERLRSQLKE